MKIAIVEDETRKLERLREVVKAAAPTAVVVEARSFNSGRKVVLEERPDLVVLDMSMPTFDVKKKDKGGRSRGFGGRDILEEVVRRGRSTKVVIVTGFDNFGEGTTKKTLDELKQELAHRFPELYLGTVFYRTASSGWEVELAQMIRRAMGTTHD